MSETDGLQTCQCVATGIPCRWPPDPSTGEALLCTGCWEDPSHREQNMVPKRLPKRTLDAR